jgi:predicted TIM-barrel fold metal-dependent hydrolase
MKHAPSRLSRRKFLRQSALAAMAPAFSAAAAISPQPIVDSHIHFYDPNKPGGVPWPPKDNQVLYSPHLPAQFSKVTAGLNVFGAVVIEAEARDADNQWVLELARQEPLVFAYIANLHPGEAGFGDKLDQYLAHGVFRGIRVQASWIPSGKWTLPFEKDLQKLAAHGLTLDVVGGSALAPKLSRLAECAPQLKIVIDHLPFPEWENNPGAMHSALGAAAANPNIYAKVSYVLRREDGKLIRDGAYYRRHLNPLWDLFGDNRVVYGSNWPVSDALGSYSDVFGVVADYVKGKGQAAADKFFWKNSQAAYGWKPRRPMPG